MQGLVCSGSFWVSDAVSVGVASMLACNLQVFQDGTCTNSAPHWGFDCRGCGAAEFSSAWVRITDCDRLSGKGPILVYDDVSMCVLRTKLGLITFGKLGGVGQVLAASPAKPEALKGLKRT